VSADQWTARLQRLHHPRVVVITGAMLIGVGAGLGAVLFRELINAVTRLATGVADHSDVGRAANPHLPWLGIWFVVLVPVVAGLVYGPLVARFAPQARGHGVPEVMVAVAVNGGRIPAKVAVVKALASALCIGAGGSVGREGPIVQIGSALGSVVGRLTRAPGNRLRTLVACGAAAGIAATFNAPVAGVFFALELILRDFAAESFGLVVLSSVTASVIGRGLLGDIPFLSLPPFTVDNPRQYLLFAVLGLVGALAGTAFSRVLYAIEDLCDAAWERTGLPEWARPAVGGVLLGLLLLALPQMYGVGYPVLSASVAGHYTVLFLLLLAIGKIVATSLTIGIGGSGGVFAPSLFIGAALGDAFGQLVAAADPTLAGRPGAYALVGMAAVFAGSARAPITAVIIMFELTGEYTIILPLMLAVVVATAVSRAISPDTIYTRKLARRGIDLDAARSSGTDTGGASSLLATVSVREVMGPVPSPVSGSTPTRQLLDILMRERSAVPVLDEHGYAGTVSVLELDGAAERATASDIAVLPDVLHPEDSAEHALQVLAAGAVGGSPVLDGDDLVGWLDHRALVVALARRRRPEPEPAPKPAPNPASGLASAGSASAAHPQLNSQAQPGQPDRDPEDPPRNPPQQHRPDPGAGDEADRQRQGGQPDHRSADREQQRGHRVADPQQDVLHRVQPLRGLLRKDRREQRQDHHPGPGSEVAAVDGDQPHPHRQPDARVPGFDRTRGPHGSA